MQDASHAVSAATREAGRAYVTSDPGDDAAARALAAARISMRDHGLDVTARQLEIDCGSEDCLAPGGAVTISLRRQVALPFVPALFGRPPASVRVSAAHLELVDRYRRTGP